MRVLEALAALAALGLALDLLWWKLWRPQLRHIRDRWREEVERAERERRP